MTKHFGIDTSEIEKDEKITETFTSLIVPVVITREAVLECNFGTCYQPANLIETVTFSALDTWIVEDHPPEIIVSRVEDTRGKVRNPRFEGGSGRTWMHGGDPYPNEMPVDSVIQTLSIL